MAKNNLEIIGFAGGSRITATIYFRPSFKCKAPRSGAICTPKRGDWSGKNLQLLSTFLGQAVTSFVHFWTGSISCRKEQQRIEGGALRIKIEQIEFGGVALQLALFAAKAEANKITEDILRLIYGRIVCLFPTKNPSSGTVSCPWWSRDGPQWITTRNCWLPHYWSLFTERHFNSPRLFKPITSKIMIVITARS